jgi:hypothetical protein
VDTEFIIENEFASVTVSVDRSGNNDRLLIVDNKTGRHAYYDALLLEALAWIPGTLLRSLLDPSLHRWPDAPAAGLVAGDQGAAAEAHSRPARRRATWQ